MTPDADEQVRQDGGRARPFKGRLAGPDALAQFGRRYVVGAFVATLLVPGLALSLSPKFRQAASTVVAGDYDATALRQTLRDSTPLWAKASTAYGTALFRLRTSSNPRNGIIGKDGFIFLGDAYQDAFSQAIHRRSLSDAQAGAWAEVLDIQRRWLAARGIPLLFVVGPSPASIYPDKLPEWATLELGRPSSLDRILAASARIGLDGSIVDLRKALTDARAKADTYSPRNTHWTDFGASVAWGQVAKVLAGLVPDFQAFGTDGSVGVVTNPNGPSDYVNLLGIDIKNPWTAYQLATPFPPMEIDGENGKTAQSSGAPTDVATLPRATRTVGAPTHKKALVIRDSMGDSLSPFLQATFEETHQLRITLSADGSRIMPPDQIQRIVDEVVRFKPDVVIYVMTERLLVMPFEDAEQWRRALGRGGA